MNRLHNKQQTISINSSRAQLAKTYRCLLLFVVIQITACGEQPQLSRLSSDSVILAFGDSLTYGTGVHADTESYPAMLEQLMGIQVVNAGVPGEVSSQARQRLKRVLNTYEPDLVILCHGGNDIIQKLSKEELKSNLIAMITEIRQSGAQVVMLAVPSLGFMVNPDPLYKQVAKEQHIVFDNDTIAELEAKPVLKSDPIHFNEAGYTLLAERIHSLLQQHGAI